MPDDKKRKLLLRRLRVVTWRAKRLLQRVWLDFKKQTRPLVRRLRVANKKLKQELPLWVLNTIVVCSILFVIACFVLLAFNPSYFTKKLEAIRNVGLTLGGIVAAVLVIWRSKISDKQTEIADRAQKDENFKIAAEFLLGDNYLKKDLGIAMLRNLAELDPKGYYIRIIGLFCSRLRQPPKPTETASGEEETKQKQSITNDLALRNTIIETAFRQLRDFKKKTDLKDIEKNARENWRVLLTNAHLQGTNLSEANLSGADLSKAYLSGADLRSANLSGADLSEADLSEAYLSGADLSEADLSEAYLSGAKLNNANLVSAILRKADLSGADLSKADLRHAHLIDAGLSEADLSDAKLSGAKLSHARLFNAGLSYADLSKADLSGAYLSKADLRHAHLIGADLRSANLSEAYLSKADLRYAHLIGAYLSNASLSDTDLSMANLANVNLSALKEVPKTIEYAFVEQATLHPDMEAKLISKTWVWGDCPDAQLPQLNSQYLQRNKLLFVNPELREELIQWSDERRLRLLTNSYEHQLFRMLLEQKKIEIGDAKWVHSEPSGNKAMVSFLVKGEWTKLEKYFKPWNDWPEETRQKWLKMAEARPKLRP